MSEWRDVKIGDTGEVVTGKTPSKDNPEDWGDVIPFVTPSDYWRYNKHAGVAERYLSNIGTDRLSGKVLPEKSIMVTCIGSDMGKVAMNTTPVVTNQQINSIIPNQSKYDPDFLYYKLVEIYELLKSYGRDGTAVPILNKGDFSNIALTFPALPEQKTIASILSCLDNKIGLLHRQNATLEALGETLFRQWFEVNAKDDWKETTVDSVLTVKGGTTPDTKNLAYWDGDIRWTSPRDLSDHQSVYLFDTSRKITPEGLRQIGSGLLPIGSVLLSSRAPIGYLAIADVEVAINQGYIGIICDKGVSNFFVYLWCKANMEKIKNSSNGSTFDEISKSVFKNLAFLQPPVGMLDRFDEAVTPIFAKIRANQKQINHLTKYRDILLPKLMSGEVRVRY